MKLIEDVLLQKKITEDQLPANIQEEINDMRRMVKSYNEACDEFESLEEQDEETENELNEMENSISEFEVEIVEKIKQLKTAEPEIPAPAPAQVKRADGDKKSSSAGWLIFGGLALVVTLGAVNVWKRSQ